MAPSPAARPTRQRRGRHGVRVEAVRDGAQARAGPTLEHDALGHADAGGQGLRPVEAYALGALGGQALSQDRGDALTDGTADNQEQAESGTTQPVQRHLARCYLQSGPYAFLLCLHVLKRSLALTPLSSLPLLNLP